MTHARLNWLLTQTHHCGRSKKLLKTYPKTHFCGRSKKLLKTWLSLSEPKPRFLNANPSSLTLPAERQKKTVNPTLKGYGSSCRVEE
jgi:hypothetical protein